MEKYSKKIKLVKGNGVLVIATPNWIKLYISGDNVVAGIIESKSHANYQLS